MQSDTSVQRTWLDIHGFKTTHLKNDIGRLFYSDVASWNHLLRSKSFEAIACAGEVSLREHEDFDKYAIEIR